MTQPTGELTRAQHIEVLESIIARQGQEQPQTREWQDVLNDATHIGEAAVHALSQRTYADYYSECDKQSVLLTHDGRGGLETVRLIATAPGVHITQRLCDLALGVPASPEHAALFRPRTSYQGLYVLQAGAVNYPLRSPEEQAAYDAVLPRTAQYISGFLTKRFVR